MGVDASAVEDPSSTVRSSMIRKIRFLFQERGVLIFFLCVLFGACEMKKIPMKEVSEIPDQAIENFTITETMSGKKHWVVESPSAKIFEDQKKAFLQKPVMTFYNKGRYVSTLTADRGFIDLSNYDIIGEGRCSLATAKGENLDTTNVHYLSQAKKIVTDERVKLVKVGIVVFGKGLEATPDLETITIKHQTTELKQ